MKCRPLNWTERRWRFSYGRVSRAMIGLAACAAMGCGDSPPAPAPAATAAVRNPPDQTRAVAKPETAPDRDDENQQAVNVEAPAARVQPQVVYRESDNRPQHDDRALAALGIHRYESKHLRLYTDIAPELAR